MYGSQTGNSKRVAEHLQRQPGDAGLAAWLIRADARGFTEFLANRRAPKLDALSFAVPGLGDSSYPQFCAIGRKLDARFAELGAKRLFAFAEADLDVDAVAGPWTRQARRGHALLRPAARMRIAFRDRQIDVQTLAEPWRRRQAACSRGESA